MRSCWPCWPGPAPGLAHAATHARHAAAPTPQSPPPPAMLCGLPAPCLSHVITAPLQTNSGSPLYRPRSMTPRALRI
ncbi:hypothetical protein RAA17_23540 [Komagataeibacter rhaeticus]|nr:hypothetical protein [Komagataeibacter rhaeticus]